MSALIAVRHNIEVAHRLHQLAGKCERIHGHSMLVRMELHGELDNTGVLEGLDFSEVKRAFRGHLDYEYDHQLLLDATDPLAALDLPGLRTTRGQPTTEHIALWIGRWAKHRFGLAGRVTVHETHVNEAEWAWAL